MPSRAPLSKLREARLKRGWSQAAVGEKLGVTGAAIGHYETGLSRPTADRAAQLAKLLGLRSGDVQTSAREAKAESGDGAKARGRKSSTKPLGGTVTNAREVAMMGALRAMPSAARGVVMDMVIAYGRPGAVPSRKRR
jgi:transcriptional regulator with XRE-family HTH domain